MSALSAAEARASSALERLEAVIGGGGRGESHAPAMLERDCEQLRQECDALRRELAAANERSDRLAALVTQVEGRLDGAIDRVDELAGS